LLRRLVSIVSRVVNPWDATNPVLKLADDPLNLSAPVNPPTLPAPVTIVAFLGLSQGAESFLEGNQKHCLSSRGRAIDRRMRMITATRSATSS
jgi:hypothetical protein